jgi:hypothetical protein
MKELPRKWGTFRLPLAYSYLHERNLIKSCWRNNCGNIFPMLRIKLTNNSYWNPSQNYHLPAIEKTAYQLLLTEIQVKQVESIWLISISSSSANCMKNIRISYEIIEPSTSPHLWQFYTLVQWFIQSYNSANTNETFLKGPRSFSTLANIIYLYALVMRTECILVLWWVLVQTGSIILHICCSCFLNQVNLFLDHWCST